MDLEKVAGFPPAKLRTMVNQIGNTPLRPVTFVVQGTAYTIHLKLEGANPTGSMKDRTGYSLIQDLESQGHLQPGSTVIESTSGNLGVALALICKAKGYHFIAVVDPKTTRENLAKMRALGAEIEMVEQPDENSGYLLSRLARVQSLCTREHYVWTNQYVNQANPSIHYRQTGPEIYQQMRGKVDAIFVPVSTGGTLAGTGYFFREMSPRTEIIGVDAYGSVVFGGSPRKRKLTGIGSSRNSSFLVQNLYDKHMLVRDEEAFAFCRVLYTKTAIKVGGSSGAVLAACVRYLQTCPERTSIVCVCADHGDNYDSSIFHDTWLQQQEPDLSSARLEAYSTLAWEIIQA